MLQPQQLHEQAVQTDMLQPMMLKSKAQPSSYPSHPVTSFPFPFNLTDFPFVSVDTSQPARLRQYFPFMPQFDVGNGTKLTPLPDITLPDHVGIGLKLPNGTIISFSAESNSGQMMPPNSTALVIQLMNGTWAEPLVEFNLPKQPQLPPPSPIVPVNSMPRSFGRFSALRTARGEGMHMFWW